MEHLLTIPLEILAHTWSVLVEAAPWLLFGLFAAGLVKWALPERRLVQLMGRRPSTQLLRATVVGAPLPLCSCGVLPAALGLRREGLSKAGTSSFLVATPQNGVDSIALSYALLGPVFTVARVATSLVSSIAAGFATLLLDPDKAPADASDAPAPDRTPPKAARASCCASQADQPPVAESSSCCSTKTSSPAVEHSKPCCSSAASAASASAAAPAPTAGPAPCCSSADNPIAPRQTFLSGQRYAFGRFLLDIGGWLAIGLLVAGAMNAFVGPGQLQSFGGGILPMLAVLVISIPMYICASASTPVAASMLLAGVSPGVVLVFLLAGPATNFAGVALIKRDMGLRATAGYLGGLILSTLALGLLADVVLLSVLDWSFAASDAQGRHLVPHWVSVPAAFIVLVLYAGLTIREALPRRSSARAPEEDQARAHTHAAA